MNKRARIAMAAAISNGMVWFGLSLFVGTIALQLAPASLSGDWYTVLGWVLLLLAALGLLVIGLVEQRTMRAARMRRRPAP